ncbi:FAD binding domain containing protein [Apiospora saccharicola]|uniref:FAD binding domain containing protein n=1 Tax=Apiospora saccharicola TaxID=335842 RepID=A0ABR1TQD5_9PEZI
MARLMITTVVAVLLAVVPLRASPLISKSVRSLPGSRCKSIQGDPTWPTEEDWARLNATVQGRLITSVRIASVCHDPTYDARACEDLRGKWGFPDSFLGSPADSLPPFFENQSCNPFTERQMPCSLGNAPIFSINTTGFEDIRAGIEFAKEKNVRLIIKNTGHDFLGKSTGKSALSLWTHNLKDIDYLESYRGGTGDYSGPVLRIGAGVTLDDLRDTLSTRGIRALTGTCSTVGIAGGFAAGGGHGLLTSRYGLAADSVLEWDVVTAGGARLTVTPTSHPDLYWSLTGGGAGTFAIVLSMTMRVYPDEPMAGARAEFDVAGAGGTERFWDAVATFQFSLGPLADRGAVVAYSITDKALSVYGMAIPDTRDLPAIDVMLEPVEDAVRDVGVPLNFSTTAHPGFLDMFDAYFEETFLTVSETQVTGGRLIPRALMENKQTATTVTQALRQVAEAGFNVICVAVNAQGPGFYSNAVFPLWRSSLLNCVFSYVWDFTRPWEEMLGRQKILTEVLMPQVQEATPGGGAYLNEANFQQSDWQETFYGANYPRLRSIKRAYDPEGILYARTGVGAEDWEQDADGRICRA